MECGEQNFQRVIPLFSAVVSALVAHKIKLFGWCPASHFMFAVGAKSKLSAIDVHILSPFQKERSNPASEMERATASFVSFSTVIVRAFQLCVWQT